MNDHVKDQLPLWIGGDVEASEATAIEAHLAQCESCRAEADAYRQSQAWLKEASLPPFEPEEREALRRTVMAQIVSRPPATARWIGWGAAVLAAASVLFLTLHRTKSPVPEAPAPRLATMEPPKLAPAPVPPLRVARRHAHPPRPDLTLTAAGPGPSRIEIQTANPRIRIIWLARATQPDTPSTLNKENS